jgi:hypothetical protein
LVILRTTDASPAVMREARRGGPQHDAVDREATHVFSEFFTLAFRGSIAVGLLIVALQFSGLLH